MKIAYFPEAERGQADFGWLKARFSFSFGQYFNPERIQFGALRVLNNDIVAAGTGFGMHPHDNMEIITIPFQGAIKHKDSLGHEAIVKSGEVQVMSAGTGIMHSEMNPSHTEDLELLQIWIFTEKQHVAPRYDQKSFDIDNQLNNFVTIVSPHDNIVPQSLWIYQQAYLNLGVFNAGFDIQYDLKSDTNGVFLFVIDGEVTVNNQLVSKRDALEITEVSSVTIQCNTKSTLLLIEVPML